MDKAKKTSRRKDTWGLPFSSRNYLWIGIGVAAIVFGYIALAQGPADSFWSRTLAPVILFLGYCVLIPLGILLKNPKED